MKSRKASWAEFQWNYRLNAQHAPASLRLLAWASLLLVGPTIASTVLAIAFGQELLLKFVQVNAWIHLAATGLMALALVSTRGNPQRIGLLAMGALWLLLVGFDTYRAIGDDFGNPYLMISPVRLVWEAAFGLATVGIALGRQTRDFVRPTAARS